MTPKDVRQLVSELRYKPGSKFSYERTGGRVSTIRFEMPVEDAYGRSAMGGIRPEYLSIAEEWLDHMTRDELIRALFEMVRSAEAHESGEWFRLASGERPFDPHRAETAKLA